MKKLCLAIFILTLTFAGSQAQWIRYKVAKNYPPDIQQLGLLKCIKELPDGNLICSDASDYAHILKDKEWYPYPDTSMLPPAHPKSMLLDSTGNLWISSTNGLRYLDVKAGRYTQYYNGDAWAYDPNDTVGIDQFYDMVKCIALDSTGGLWLSGMSNAYELARLKDGVWTKYLLPDTTGPKYFVAGEGGSPSMEIQKDGTVWYRSYGGIVRFRPQSNEWTLFDTLRIGDSIINLGYASRIMAASDGTVWISAELYYMLNFNPETSQWTMYTQFDIPSVRSDDTNRNVYCKALAEDKRGNIWATLFPDYLAKFDAGLKKWTKKMQLPDGVYASQGVLNFIGYGLCVDRKGNVWVGTREEGVDVYTGEATGVTDAEAVDDTFAHTWIFSVAPNPVIHSARAQIFADPALRASLRVGIYSLQGELLCDVTDKVQIDAVSGHGTVELEPVGLPTGAYMLRVANGSDYHCTMIAVIK